MSKRVDTGDPFSSRYPLGFGYEGMVGTVRFRLLRDDGSVDDPAVGPTTSSIVEDPADSGHYVYIGEAPAEAGSYTPAFDLGDGTDLWYDEAILVGVEPLDEAFAVTAATVKSALSASEPFDLWKDNRDVPITDIITYPDGSPMNLTGRTVKLMARPSGSAALKIDASATVVSALAGGVEYDPAAIDVDTVGTFIGWWRITTTASGKFRDTDEFTFRVVEHAPSALPISIPVADDGTATIYRGDAYLAASGRALVYQLLVNDMPDLTGLTLSFRIAGQLEVAASLSEEDTVSVDLTSADTDGVDVGTWDCELEAEVSPGNVVTLMRSTIEVLPDLAAPS